MVTTSQIACEDRFGDILNTRNTQGINAMLQGYNNRPASVMSSSVVVSFGGKSNQLSSGSCSHSTTTQKYSPLSATWACRMISSKIGPLVRRMLIRHLSPAAPEDVTTPSRPELRMVRLDPLYLCRQVTAKPEDPGGVTNTVQLMVTSVFALLLMLDLDCRESLLSVGQQTDRQITVVRNSVLVTVAC